jgi:hypothetical protein
MKLESEVPVGYWGIPDHGRNWFERGYFLRLRGPAFVAALMLGFIMLNAAVRAQPLMPPHMGPSLPDWLIGGLMGFFVGGGICMLFIKIAEVIGRAARGKTWSRILGVIFIVLGLAAWAYTIYFLAVEL